MVLGGVRELFRVGERRLRSRSAAHADELAQVGDFWLQGGGRVLERLRIRLGRSGSRVEKSRFDRDRAGESSSQEQVQEQEQEQVQEQEQEQVQEQDSQARERVVNTVTARSGASCRPEYLIYYKGGKGVGWATGLKPLTAQTTMVT